MCFAHMHSKTSIDIFNHINLFACQIKKIRPFTFRQIHLIYKIMPNQRKESLVRFFLFLFHTDRLVMICYQATKTHA